MSNNDGQWGGEQQSLGQNFNQQGFNQQGGSSEYQGGYQAPQGGQNYGQPGGPQSGPQGTQPGPQQWNNQGFNQQRPAGEGVGAVMGDMKFQRSLTESLAGPTFMLITIATGIWLLFDVVYGFMGDKWSSGGSDVSLKMAIFPAILNLLADLAIAGAIILSARVLLELAINVARNRRD